MAVYIHSRCLLRQYRVKISGLPYILSCGRAGVGNVRVTYRQSQNRKPGDSLRGAFLASKKLQLKRLGRRSGKRRGEKLPSSPPGLLVLGNLLWFRFFAGPPAPFLGSFLDCLGFPFQLSFLGLLRVVFPCYLYEKILEVSVSHILLLFVR